MTRTGKIFETIKDIAALACTVAIMALIYVIL